MCAGLQCPGRCPRDLASATLFQRRGNRSSGRRGANMMVSFLLIATSGLGGAAPAATIPAAIGLLVSAPAVATTEDPKDELKRRADALKPDDAEGNYQLALW